MRALDSRHQCSASRVMGQTMAGKGPLAGIRVVDLTRAMAGPYATLMLADAGADVTKIERPGTGDDTRGWGPPFVGRPGAEESTYFLSVNRNKQSVQLDFKDPRQAERLRALIRRADVLAENFRPGVMEKLGLGEEALEALNPHLVVLSITGFGEGGPDGHRPGFDQILQGEGGLMSLTGPVGGPPTKVGVPIADILAGMFGAYGVAAALVERERSGRGQWVRTSLLAGMVGITTFQGTRWLVAGEVPEPSGNRHPTIQPYGAYEVADGVVNIAVGSEGLWRRFAPLVGVQPDDPRFAANGDRVRNVDELEAVIGPALAADTLARWLARLDGAGVPAGRVSTMRDVFSSPQVAQLGLIDTVAHATLGAIRLPGTPVSFSRSGRPSPQAPPTLGQHTDDVLRDLDP
jgi:crotonobetainyl-CoA:carnitine CoA-transferase CaiB-like acyl-CoA transferase